MTRGILEAHRNGIVRSASLLVTYPESAEAAGLAACERGLEVGLHLDLVGAGPAADPSAVRSIVDREGRFHPLGVFVRRILTGRVRASDIATEVRAQARRARSFGISPLAWDSHRHVHLIPFVARVVGALAREEGVRWLRRGRSPRAARGWKPRALSISTLASEGFFRGIPGNDWYLDLSSWRPQPDPATLGRLPMTRGSGELGCHPGEIDDRPDPADALAGRRVAELALLTEPAVLAALGRAVAWRVPARSARGG
ncbi:MAG: ChbG/HpnK family deacetylase [Chloroflexota bacterium]|nr:ChbG/HpnK family deacetylase [Chloroflexota bacterium]